jgi:hypothetical protein
MDENMRRQAMSLCTIILAGPVLLAFMGGAPTDARALNSAAQQYCNDKYMYCVKVPPSGTAVQHEPDAPNHGVTVDLPQTGEEIWTYAHWDAALLDGSQKAAFERLEIIFTEHPDADVSIARAMLAELSAYRIRFRYTATQPMTEEIIIAYRKPKDQSKDTGIIYEIGMKSAQSTYKANAGTFKSFVDTFRQMQ